ncbi:translational initiation factor [Methylobacterium nonmethylotrophicum]|uniref:Translational initiation factor n=1 Tax=Methylobacterium nonmethylotrophicum TaxID=1141884 RepID=A0A4Z0NEG2_9HYPH|nr:translational initiation factor [Methylobacterium nonmethylotrophicum]TGD92490.1 translational initiation factor [Methylobacterium nonmethylotrophicum]
MKTFSLLLAAAGVALAGTVAVAAPWPAGTSYDTDVVRTGSGDGAGFPGAPGGRAGAPGRVGGWSGGRAASAEPEGLRGYCIALLDGARQKAPAFHPADCADLYAAAARPDQIDDADEAVPGPALARACAALLRSPGTTPPSADPNACSSYVTTLDPGTAHHAATGSGDRAPDGPSIAGGVGGKGGRAGSGGPGAGAGGAGGVGLGGTGGAGGPSGSVR